MNQNLLSLMKNAGFVFWEDEEWKPEDAVIDWATNYDKEIEKFAELLIRECCVTADANIDDSKYPSYWIKRKFGVEE